MTAKAQIESQGLDFAIDGHSDILFEMFESRSDVPFDELDDLPVTLDKIKSAKVFVTVAALYCPDTYNGGGAADFLSRLVAYAEKYLTGLSSYQIGQRTQRLHRSKNTRNDLAHRKRRRVVGV